jgi:hypothetical protein
MPRASGRSEREVQRVEHVLDRDEVALLLAVRDARAMRAEELHAPRRADLVEGVQHDARHAPLCRSPKP